MYRSRPFPPPRSVSTLSILGGLVLVNDTPPRIVAAEAISLNYDLAPWVPDSIATKW